MDNDSIEPFDDLFEPFDPKDRPREAPLVVSPEDPGAATGTVMCSSCGSPNDPRNVHCDQCGARLGRGQMPVAPQPMLRTTAGARALIVLATVVLAVAVMALVVNLFSGGGDATAEETSTTSTSIATVPITELAPIRVTCSSELSAFPCTALIDADPNTSWNAIEGGIGVELTFLFSPPVQITEMIIQNVDDECRFLRNARMRGIEVLVDDLTQATVEELADSRDAQRVQIRSLRTSSLSIRITSAYPGQTCEGREPFTELAAQDIFFYGRQTPGE
jgi:hypothetical protein